MLLLEPEMLEYGQTVLRVRPARVLSSRNLKQPVTAYELLSAREAHSLSRTGTLRTKPRALALLMASVESLLEVTSSSERLL